MEAAAAAAAPAPAPKADAQPVGTTLRPQHVHRESARSVTVLLQVAGVDASSVKLLCRPTYVSVGFTAQAPGAAAPQAYAFILSPLRPVNPDACRVDVASDNMVLLLAKEAPGMWGELGVVAEPGAQAYSEQQAAAAAATPVPVPTPAVETPAPASSAAPGADFIASASFAGAKPGYVFKADKRGLGYYLDSVQGASPASAAKGAGKALPAPRRSARVVTHATGSSATKAAKRPHPLTGAPEVGEPGAVAVAAAADLAAAEEAKSAAVPNVATGAGGAGAGAAASASAPTGGVRRGPAGASEDLSAVNLQNTMIFEID